MEIDINDIRSLYTVLMFSIFIGIWIWAWSSKRKADFDEAANLPFTEEGQTAIAGNKKETNHE